MVTQEKAEIRAETSRTRFKDGEIDETLFHRFLKAAFTQAQEADYRTSKK